MLGSGGTHRDLEFGGSLETQTTRSPSFTICLRECLRHLLHKRLFFIRVQELQLLPRVAGLLLQSGIWENLRDTNILKLLDDAV